MYIEVPLFSETSPALKNSSLRACKSMLFFHVLVVSTQFKFYKKYLLK